MALTNSFDVRNQLNSGVKANPNKFQRLLVEYKPEVGRWRNILMEFTTRLIKFQFKVEPKLIIKADYE